MWRGVEGELSKRCDGGKEEAGGWRMRVWSVVRTRMDARVVYVRASKGCECVSFAFHTTSGARRAKRRGNDVTRGKRRYKRRRDVNVAVENRAQDFPNPRRRLSSL